MVHFYTPLVLSLLLPLALLLFYTLYICSKNICTYVLAVLLPGILARGAFQGYEKHFLPVWHVPKFKFIFYCLKVIFYWWLSFCRVEVFQGYVAVTLGRGALQGHSKDTKILPTNLTFAILIISIKPYCINKTDFILWLQLKIVAICADFLFTSANLTLFVILLVIVWLFYNRQILFRKDSLI